jgi:hypothetical protein
MLQLKVFFGMGIERKSLQFEFFQDALQDARKRLNGRPLTIEEFGVGAAAATRLREVMFGPK